MWDLYLCMPNHSKGVCVRLWLFCYVCKSGRAEAHCSLLWPSLLCCHSAQALGSKVSRCPMWWGSRQGLNHPIIQVKLPNVIVVHFLVIWFYWLKVRIVICAEQEQIIESPCELNVSYVMNPYVQMLNQNPHTKVSKLSRIQLLIYDITSNTLLVPLRVFDVLQDLPLVSIKSLPAVILSFHASFLSCATCSAVI